jgi:hypothetical protein
MYHKCELVVSLAANGIAARIGRPVTGTVSVASLYGEAH